MRVSLKLTFTIAAALLLTACSGLGIGRSDGEETLTLRYWQAPSLPFPYLSGGDKDEDAAAITLEPLANYEPDGSLVPKLAVQIPTIENGGVSQDLLTITWRLKEDVNWSDGSDLTASDAVFTWRYCIDEATGCVRKDAFDGVASVEAIDDLTVRITFDAPTPYPYGVFVSARMPIISAAQFADCIAASARTAACETHNAAPLGTGPYRIVHFAVNDGAEYERNPFYRGERPYFDKIVMQGGGDADTAARAVLQRSDADYAWNLQIEPHVLRELEAAGLGSVHSASASLVERIVVNQTNPDAALGDDRSEYMDGANPHPFLTFTPIPQAMSMAIDRSAIAELYGFAAAPTCNLIAAPANYASTANEACLSQDIDGANRLLDDSGVIDQDGDGIREHNGVPLRIAYQTTANAIRQDTQALIREWWREIGIDTELIQHDASVFFGGDPGASGALYRRFLADVQMYTEGSDADPQQALSVGLCSHIQTRANNWGGGNNARSCNAEYDEAFERLAHTPVGAQREALVKRLNDIAVQNYYEIPLVNRGLVSATLNTLQGVRLNAWDSGLWNIAEWHR